MNHEVKLLNSIIDTKDYVSAVNGGVDNVFIEYRDVWNFIMSHHDQHGKVPSKETVKQHHPDFDTDCVRFALGTLETYSL